jgi:hypothetical protein
MCVGKIALFDKALASALARGALAMCAMRVGFSFFFCGWEKKKNKFIQSALSCQKAKFFLFSIYQYRIYPFVCLFTLVANVPKIHAGRDLTVEFPE